jgi:hypothetical protein
MEQAIRLDDARTTAEAAPRLALDTTFVLFFLGMDVGQSFSGLGADGILSIATLAMLMFVPYFLPFDDEKPQFAKWFKGRVVIAVFAVFIGLGFRQAVGNVLPETLKYFPMSLLIISAIISAFVQFYGILRLRLAR